MIKAFGRGSRGYVIERLQKALRISADGVFGPMTEDAVEKRQLALGSMATGRADQGFFDTLGVKWPGVFERSLQVTASFEGTGFGGVNKKDIDGAGVTLGITGLTTKHGEVQNLIREYAKLRPTALHNIGSPAKEKLLVLLNKSEPNAEAWEDWFYGRDGVVDPWIRDVVASWGEDTLFQRLQLAYAETNQWLPALRSAKALGLTTEHGQALMFDVQVQNGGWRDSHQKYYNAQSHNGRERARLLAIVNAVASNAITRWREDVRKRKSVFLDGRGKVHGRNYELTDYAFGQI